jgi:hypothetical protein
MTKLPVPRDPAAGAQGQPRKEAGIILRLTAQTPVVWARYSWPIAVGITPTTPFRIPDR